MKMSTIYSVDDITFKRNCDVALRNFSASVIWDHHIATFLWSLYLEADKAAVESVSGLVSRNLLLKLDVSALNILLNLL